MTHLERLKKLLDLQFDSYWRDCLLDIQDLRQLTKDYYSIQINERKFQFNSKSMFLRGLKSMLANDQIPRSEDVEFIKRRRENLVSYLEDNINKSVSL